MGVRMNRLVWAVAVLVAGCTPPDVASVPSEAASPTADVAAEACDMLAPYIGDAQASFRSATMLPVAEVAARGANPRIAAAGRWVKWEFRNGDPAPGVAALKVLDAVAELKLACLETYNPAYDPDATTPAG